MKKRKRPFDRSLRDGNYASLSRRSNPAKYFKMIKMVSKSDSLMKKSS